MNRTIVLKYHTIRLDNLLLSNGLKRIPTIADGNCFLSAVVKHISSEGHDMNVQILREKLVDHMSREDYHYKRFISFDHETTVEGQNQKFDSLLQDFSIDGHWNNELADFMPLALANMYNRPLRIYSSMVSNSVYDIIPDLQDTEHSQEYIKVALIAIKGQEHYDAVCHLDEVLERTSQADQSTIGDCSPPVMNNVRTPMTNKRKRSTPVTPRKRANYKSPVKKQLFRKKKKNQEVWKRNVRQFNRVHGLPYTGLTGKEQAKKKMQYRDCSKCKFKCSLKITARQAGDIFATYYQLGSYEKQRNFICQHVEQTKSKRCTTNRKENSNTYFLTTDGKKERVCKAFFLGILHVSKKTVEYSLKKKEHGVFVGRDNRGKNPSINRTPEGDRHFIREHIQSFPTVSSHYTRKDSNRQYLSSNLSVQKMHQLYEKEYQRKGKKPCKINVYRDTFCNEFNLAFHKPKKDQCSTCTIYYEKKQRGEITKEDEEQFQEHQTKKEKSREEKRLDKERAKTDRSFAAVTFDLEAVLPTPCSMVGDLFYKRCLSTYNLSFYSLGDSKGTCYLWDETNGGRGSSDIGSCILMHINSIAEKNTAVEEITYFSDTCGGQNRNQFVASALLYALHFHSNLKAINHKFFERGHSEMEADSIHSSVKRAKKSTKVYHPSQWDTVVSMARKTNPYIVIPVNYRDFYDLKGLKTDFNINLKRTVSGETINWLKVKWIRVTKENPGSVFFNNGFDPENFMEAKFQSSSLRGRKKKTGNIKLSPLYESKLQISAAKKADLLSLCKSGVIPTTYHSYYESLLVGKLVKDTLPEPDITEEDLIDNI
ncbi:uncharacterized protein LOC127712922 [Mytilus californianus]|uniref:uncharacterized protein LOC127712922 n=1 Tax=Mytilus californianus TaxID=6549 RepID=UPI002246370C|nr:uncharacterized protein LOC127712922 [Mytilus californianus]